MTENNLKQNNKTTPKTRPTWMTILIHVFLIIVVGFLLIKGVSIWLNHFTRQSDIVYIPNVKGMQFDEAQSFLTNAGFSVELSDSIYDTKAKRGAVVDQNPKDSTTVRPGRTVYLTINAFYPRMVSIPPLTDISARQAKVTLEGIGIKNIITKEVPSIYDGLVLGVFMNGKQLTPGSRIPVTSKIVLEVGKGEDIAQSKPDNNTVTSSDNASNETTITSESTISSEPDYFD